jgi:hypothetical protein
MYRAVSGLPSAGLGAVTRAARLFGSWLWGHEHYRGGRGPDWESTELPPEERRRLRAYLAARPAPW